MIQLRISSDTRAFILSMALAISGTSCKSRSSAQLESAGGVIESFENNDVDLRRFQFLTPDFFKSGVRVPIMPVAEGEVVKPENVKTRSIEDYLGAMNEFFLQNSAKDSDNLFLGFFKRFHAIQVPIKFSAKFSENELLDFVAVEKKNAKVLRADRLFPNAKQQIESLGTEDGWHGYFILPVPEQGSLKALELFDLSLQFLAIFGSNFGPHMRSFDSSPAGVVDPQYDLYFNWLETRVNVNAGHLKSELALMVRYRELLSAIIKNDRFYLMPGLLDRNEFEGHFKTRLAAVEEHIGLLEGLVRQQKRETEAQNADESVRAKRVMQVLDKSSFQADTIAAKSTTQSLKHRKAVAAIMSNYMPWKDFSTVEKNYWFSVLESIRNPLPPSKRIVALRGIDFQNKTEKVPGTELEFEFCKKVNTNQNSVNHAFRGFATVREPDEKKPENGFIPFGGKANAWPNYGSDAAKNIGHEPRIGQMLANHSQSPEGSFFLSSTLQPSTAESFGGKAVLFLLTDPRRVWPAALTTFESEDEFLTPVLFFPDEIIQFRKNENGAGGAGGFGSNMPAGEGSHLALRRNNFPFGIRIAGAGPVIGGPFFPPIPVSSFTITGDVIPAVKEKFPGVQFESLVSDVFTPAGEEFLFDRYFEILDLSLSSRLPNQIAEKIPHIEKVLAHPSIKNLATGAIKKDNVEAAEKDLGLNQPDLSGF